MPSHGLLVEDMTLQEHIQSLHTWMDIKDVSKHFFFEVMKGTKYYAMDSKHK